MARPLYDNFLKGSFASLVREPMTVDVAEEAWQLIPHADYPQLYDVVGANPTPIVLIVRAAREMGMDIAALASDIDVLIGEVSRSQSDPDSCSMDYANPNSVDPFVLRMLVMMAHLSVHVTMAQDIDDSSTEAMAESMAAFVRKLHGDGSEIKVPKIIIAGAPMTGKMAVAIDTMALEARDAMGFESTNNLDSRMSRKHLLMSLSLMLLHQHAERHADDWEVLKSEGPRLITLGTHAPVRWIDEPEMFTAYERMQETRGQRKFYQQELRAQNAQRHRANEARSRRYLKRK